MCVSETRTVLRAVLQRLFHGRTQKQRRGKEVNEKFLLCGTCGTLCIFSDEEKAKMVEILKRLKEQHEEETMENGEQMSCLEERLAGINLG